MDKSAAAADDVERGDYEQEHERTGAFPLLPLPMFRGIFGVLRCRGSVKTSAILSGC